MKKYIIFFWMSSIVAMEKEPHKLIDYNLSYSPEQLKEKEDRKKELETAVLLHRSLNIPLVAPHACKPKHLYFPDLNKEEEEKK